MKNISSIVVILGAIWVGCSSTPDGQADGPTSADARLAERAGMRAQHDARLSAVSVAAYDRWPSFAVMR